MTGVGHAEGEKIRNWLYSRSLVGRVCMRISQSLVPVPRKHELRLTSQFLFFSFGKKLFTLQRFCNCDSPLITNPNAFDSCAIEVQILYHLCLLRLMQCEQA